MVKNRTVREFVAKNKKWKVRVTTAAGGNYEVHVLHWMENGGYLSWEETASPLRVGDLSSAEFLAQQEARRLG